MNIVLLKSKSDKVNITSQQNAIIKYAKSAGLSLDVTEIENSQRDAVLEERKEFKGFLRSLSHNDSLLIYDLWTFSDDVGELNKILECLLKRSISVHLCFQNTIVDENTPSLETLSILADFREKQLNKDKTSNQGRPKGRMSKSKFDTHRKIIVDYLAQDKSVSEIARLLGVRRTSLKDYINSRGLKELVQAKKTLLHSEPLKKAKKTKPLKNQECSLIKKETNNKDKHYENL